MRSVSEDDAAKKAKDHARRMAKEAPRAGGESQAFPEHAAEAALAEALGHPAAGYLRASATVIALAQEGGCRADDVLNMNVRDTLRRLVDPADGATQCHANGVPFHTTEGYNSPDGRAASGAQPFQICIGAGTDRKNSKARQTMYWKDAGLYGGTAHRLLVEWATRLRRIRLT